MSKLGVITIGEAPRLDVEPTFKRILGENQEITQVGVLDGLTKEEAELTFKPVKNEYTMVSRFQNGDSVRMSRNKITPVIQKKIDELEEIGCKKIFLLCTGVFYGLKTRGAVFIEPEKIIPSTIMALIGNHRLGIIGPLEKQESILKEKWCGLKNPPYYVSASPYIYSKKELRRAARTLAEHDVKLILLDCMGYVEEMRQVVKAEVNGIPVVLSNALLIKLISELTV